METEDPLSQLKDIHLPGPVSFWPPAPGWWILLLILVVALAFIYRKGIAALIRRRKLARVLAELERSYETFREQSLIEEKRNNAGLEFLAEVNVLLKRVAQVRIPRSGAASLSGGEWLRFLDRQDGITAFSQGPGTPLADAIYRRNFDADADALYSLARGWIENRYRDDREKQESMPAGGISA